MITAALKGKLENVKYPVHFLFKMMIPGSCPGVTSEILRAKFIWEHKDSYVQTAHRLDDFFVKFFEGSKDQWVNKS